MSNIYNTMNVKYQNFNNSYIRNSYKSTPSVLSILKNTQSLSSLNSLPNKPRPGPRFKPSIINKYKTPLHNLQPNQVFKSSLHPSSSRSSGSSTKVNNQFKPTLPNLSELSNLSNSSRLHALSNNQNLTDVYTNQPILNNACSELNSMTTEYTKQNLLKSTLSTRTSDETISDSDEVQSQNSNSYNSGESEPIQFDTPQRNTI